MEAGPTPLEDLQGLQQDLHALLESRLSNVDRLAIELQSRVEDFRRLLDRNRRNEQSRKAIKDAPQDKTHPELGSVLTIDDVQYAVTEDFKNAIYTVADEVDLDELEAAKLCIDVQNNVDVMDDTIPFRALLQFHSERQITLDCVRLLFQKLDEEGNHEDDVLYDFLEGIMKDVLRSGSSGSNAFWERCCEGLTETEEMVSKTHSQLEAMAMTDNYLAGARGETLQAQRMFLARQHEALAAIMSHVVRTGNINVTDYKRLITRAAAADPPLDLLSHYVPPLIAGARHFGAGNISDPEAREVYRLLGSNGTQLMWKSSYLHAAGMMCWLVEYSARHADPVPGIMDDTHKDDNPVSRHKAFFDCLDEKGFHFLLAVADFLKPELWHDPAKAGLIRFLLDDTMHFPATSVASSPYFAQLTMQGLQGFTEAFISYMPDVLRQLKSEEDDKRRNNLHSEKPFYEMHLERFLMIVAYAYQDDPIAAKEFWNDVESNLYGFLRWSSTRLPTPRVAAFCEVMRALANREDTADHAHRFLLEDGSASGNKLRKGYSVSWAQIFSELELYASTFKNKPAVLPSSTAPAMSFLDEPDIAETETPIMLEAYLRLITHVLRHSALARSWVLRGQPFKLHETLLRLASSNTLPAVQACCFSVLAALLTDKPADINDGLWLALDSWISGGGSISSDRSQVGRTSEKHYLQRYAGNAEVATALVHLLNALVVPVSGSTNVALDTLPFPEQLGATSRRSGIDAYVDFVFDQAFLASVDPATSGDRLQMFVLRHACLTFADLCLTTFNEDLSLLAHNKANLKEAGTLLKSTDKYIQQHPFARAFEYLFNDRVVAVLLIAAQQSLDEMETLPLPSPLVQSTIKAVTVMDLVMQKQATYFDVVRPQLKTQGIRRVQSVANPAISSFDDILTSNLNVVLYLANYAASAHTELTLISLSLLSRMASSPRIAGVSHRDNQRLTSKLADDSEALQIELRKIFDLDLRELEDQMPPMTFLKAEAFLELLQAGLRNNPDMPNITHSLLGFRCERSEVSIAPETLFASGKSLFHRIAEAAVSLPSNVFGNHTLLLQSVKSKCVQLLTSLSTAQLTRGIALGELRSMDYLGALHATADLVLQDALWEGCQAQDPDLYLKAGPEVLVEFLLERSNTFDYALRELHAASANGIASARDKVMSVLSGGTPQAPSASIFDLLDFYDISFPPPLDVSLHYLKDVDLASFPVDDNGRWDIKGAQQLLILIRREMWQKKAIKDQSEEQGVIDEISAVLGALNSQNRYVKLVNTRLDALESWTDLVAAFSEAQRDGSVAQQGLQLILLRLDKAFRDDIEAAQHLAKLTLVLVKAVSQQSTSTPGAHENLIQVFRSCTRAVIDSATDAGLRDVCYRICCTIISTLLAQGQKGVVQRQNLARHVHDLGDRIVRVLSEDVFAGRGATRISALIFLDSIFMLSANGKGASLILKALTKVNFIPVLIDNSVGSIAATFRSADVDLDGALAYFHTASSLLLRTTQVAEGPQLILQSNFIGAIEDSGLFSTDPDIGLDIDNPEALEAYYQLLSAITRILVAIVVRRGPGDGAVMQTVRRFISENRMSVSAIFKLASRQGPTRAETKTQALAVAEELSRLLFVTDFLENDEVTSNSVSSGHRFT